MPVVTTSIPVVPVVTTSIPVVPVVTTSPDVGTSTPVVIGVVEPVVKICASTLLLLMHNNNNNSSSGGDDVILEREREREYFLKECYSHPSSHKKCI